jgi:hypothetical protein
MESLGERVLLSTYSVPTSGVTAVYLTRRAGHPGWVDIYLNSVGATPDATLTDTSDLISSTTAGMLFVDTIPAADKPTGGISFVGGTGSTLELRAGAAIDTTIDVAKTMTGATITSTDTNSVAATDTYGSGIANLTIVPNAAGGATVTVPSVGQILTIDTASSTGNIVNLGNFSDNGGVAGAVVNMVGGSNTLNLVSDGDEVTSATVNLGTASGNTLTVGGGATTAYLATAQTIDTVSISDGTVQLNQSGDWTVNTAFTTFGSLTISAGVLDLGAQELKVTGTLAATIDGYLTSAYSSNAWTGSGITSSYAIGAPSTFAVGYALYADNASTGLGLSSGQAMIRPTVAGDANLDGFVDVTDLGIVQNNTGVGTRWALGDFNYSHSVDSADLAIVNANAGLSFPS